MRTTRMFAGAASLAAATTFGLAGPAAAAPPQQEGLVNVNVTDLVVQVPISVAANICDVNVAVLAQGLVDDAAACDAAGDSEARVTRDAGGPGTQQSGLVNVNLEDVTVQIPVSLAANVCDVNVAVLTGPLFDDAEPCTASAVSDAVITPITPAP